MADQLSSPTSLTAFEADAMRIIQEIMDADGHPPTLQELAHELGLTSRSAGFRVVAILVRKGWLRRLPGRHRYNVQILHRVPAAEELGTMDVKAVGAIAAEAITILIKVNGEDTVTRDLADRLLKAMGGPVEYELTQKGAEVCLEA